MNIPSGKTGSFQQKLIDDFTLFAEEEKEKFPDNEVLKIDLHCHDHNSDVPDELLGRILNVPETWLKTNKLVKTLQDNGSDVITITNHNNARSCFELQQKGIDVLTAAEFSCTVPDFNIGIHVLTYGFTEDQEKYLNKLRRNLYSFLQFTHENNIPTIWAHPLYYYSPKGIPPFDFFHKLALLFERFEVLNGQRDTWQNLLVKTWIESLSPASIDEYAKKFKINPRDFCNDPYKKSFSGGSDSHMGIFAGLTGTRLHVPDLSTRRQTEALSDLALEAIRAGNMAPFGTHQNSEKLTIAFLDYVFQIALNKKDPGLLRILLHKGNPKDKTLALLISNAFSELQRHKVTMNFIDLFHNCFMGKVPNKSKRWLIPKVYKPVFDEASNIAKNRNNGTEDLVGAFNTSITSISNSLNSILYSRLNQKIDNLSFVDALKDVTLNNLLEQFELPSEIRSYLEKKKSKSDKNKKAYNVPDIPEFLDGLSFPFLASSLILAANYTSAKVLYNNRSLLQSFSENLGNYVHPKRMLWLSDTFEDNNGVSMVLKSMHEEIKRMNLPIDILVCSNSVQPDDHLLVLKPLAEYQLPMYEQQPLRIPNFLDIHKLFHTGEYDRLICSTEGPMGLATIYLKNAYSVKAHFYIHTDWIMFGKKVLKMDSDNISRFRRLLRAFYHNFDSLFVLNTDHQKWLTSKDMGFNSRNVFLTSHWAEDSFVQKKTYKMEALNLNEEAKVLLFAGRISHEKGVMELPEIMEKVKNAIPDIHLVVAGSGPAEEELRAALPDATFLGWVDHHDLPAIYSAADLLVLPSKFDTFSCVVLESLSCGLPVVAYDTKGPKDIIEHGKSGFVVSNRTEMIESIKSYFRKPGAQIAFKEMAILRSKDYAKERIMQQFLEDVELVPDVNIGSI
ncbi:MAG: glycosyltransferase [Bacteroidales bacterium]|nr:glycosyltransferase [Bacteroidales bacterium]MCF8458817.1 glycosyltransferase [Bacteroidales bacterium]